MKIAQSKAILELTKKMSILFGPSASKEMAINLKSDKSAVTEIDLFVSNLLKDILKNHPEYSHYLFFSEEEFGELAFPAAILDPIDGTREMIKGLPECAISLGLMKSPVISDPENYGWIYNPFSGFSLDSSDLFIPSNHLNKQKLLGMVSRSEYEKGYFNQIMNNEDERVEITPRGSIAFKLGLLASGACDFVLSLSPKNIWDIAAGTILCSQRGIRLYQNGAEIKSLDDVKMQGVLLWAPEELSDFLIKKIHK